MAEELCLKKSSSFKDPAKTSSPKEFPWNQLENAPTRQIQRVIRPKILAMDMQGCERIRQKLEEEKEREQIGKQWQEQHRDDRRSALIERHQAMSQLE